jgi:hypothetical protein
MYVTSPGAYLPFSVVLVFLPRRRLVRTTQRSDWINYLPLRFVHERDCFKASFADMVWLCMFEARGFLGASSLPRSALFLPCWPWMGEEYDDE